MKYDKGYVINLTKIFIVTNPGFFNKGDAALILGALKTLGKIEGAEVNLLSVHPEFEHSRCNATLIHIPNPSKKRNSIVGTMRYVILIIQHVILSILYRIIGLRIIPPGIIEKNILEEYYKSDIIVAGIDDSFTTLYGPEPFMTNFRAILISKVLNKSVVLYAGSIGPFKNKCYEILGRYIIDQADLVTLREEISLEYLKKIGVSNSSMYVTADLAFALQPSSPARAKEILEFEGIGSNEAPLIGISLSRVISKWAFQDIHEPSEKYHKYLTIMAQVIDHLIEELSATMIFIPQVIGPTENNDDRNTAEAMAIFVKFHCIPPFSRSFTLPESLFVRGVLETLTRTYYGFMFKSVRINSSPALERRGVLDTPELNLYRNVYLHSNNTTIRVP